MLEPYRREFQQKLQQYQQVVLNILQTGNAIDDGTRQELQNLQQVLELRNEDTIPIEARVAAYLKARKQNLKTYKEAFSEALRQEYPQSEATRLRLQQLRQQFELSDADVASIETQITAEVETYRRNLQQYEQAFVAATRQEYPLSEVKRNELRQQQLSLELTDVEIAPIEAKVTTQVETYQQKLQKYEEAFINATQRKHQPSEVTRTQLQQTWQTLGLSEIDAKKIEAPILAQIETYQVNLRLYEQEFSAAIEQQYPLSDAKCSELRQRQQLLGLGGEDVASIENLIIVSIEEHLQKLQQYEQVFSASIRFECPISESTREELRRLQQVLEINHEEVNRIEAAVNDQLKSQVTIPENQGKQNTPQQEKSKKLVSSLDNQSRESKAEKLAPVKHIKQGEDLTPEKVSLGGKIILGFGAVIIFGPVLWLSFLSAFTPTPTSTSTPIIGDIKTGTTATYVHSGKIWNCTCKESNGCYESVEYAVKSLWKPDNKDYVEYSNSGWICKRTNKKN